METMDAITKRTSVRKYTDTPVSEEDIKAILKAGLRAPSAVNCREWEMYVVQDRNILNQMADINGPAANSLRECAFAVLMCGNYDKAYANAKDFWILDVSFAIENMCLAATDLGIGSLILGTYPMENKVEGQRRLFNLPTHIIPHSIIAFGYDKNNTEPKPVLESDWEKVHYIK